MEANCIDVERIGEIVDLPADDPERRHAEACPRCRSLVESYRAFMIAEPVVGSGLERARGVLDARIREGAQRWIPTEARSSRLTRESWWHGLLKPAPLLAGAAAVTVAALFLWTSRGPEESVLRDSEPPSAGVLTVGTAAVGSDGFIRLSWTPTTGADAYQVRVYGPDLNEVYRSPSVAETTTVIDRAVLPLDLPPTLDLTWRVYALLGGDVVEVSAPGSIRAP